MSVLGWRCAGRPSVASAPECEGKAGGLGGPVEGERFLRREPASLLSLLSWKPSSSLPQSLGTRAGNHCRLASSHSPCPLPQTPPRAWLKCSFGLSRGREARLLTYSVLVHVCPKSFPSLQREAINTACSPGAGALCRPCICAHLGH